MLAIANKLADQNAQFVKKIADLEQRLSKDEQLMQTISGKVDDLKAAIPGTIDSQISNLRTELRQWPVGVGQAANGLNCPPGQYITALAVDTSSGGPHGIVYGIHIGCLPIVK